MTQSANLPTLVKRTGDDVDPDIRAYDVYLNGTRIGVVRTGEGVGRTYCRWEGYSIHHGPNDRPLKFTLPTRKEAIGALMNSHPMTETTPEPAAIYAALTPAQVRTLDTGANGYVVGGRPTRAALHRRGLIDDVGRWTSLGRDVAALNPHRRTVPTTTGPFLTSTIDVSQSHTYRRSVTITDAPRIPVQNGRVICPDEVRFQWTTDGTPDGHVTTQISVTGPLRGGERRDDDPTVQSVIYEYLSDAPAWLAKIAAELQVITVPAK